MCITKDLIIIEVLCQVIKLPITLICETRTRASLLLIEFNAQPTELHGSGLIGTNLRYLYSIKKYSVYSMLNIFTKAKPAKASCYSFFSTLP